MTFKSGANGIEKKGKTKGKNLGDSGPTAGVQTGGKKTLGVTGKAMRVSAGDPGANDVKTSGMKIRGTGCATKGVMARGPMA